MSIWFRATATFNDDVFIKTKKSPVNIIKEAFKTCGIDFDAEYSECSIKQDSRCGNISISICNPDCYINEIHATLKYLVANYSLTRCRSIEIESHYYTHVGDSK